MKSQGGLRSRPGAGAALLLAAMLGAAGARDTFAHCDTMDGPVVQDARRALDTGAIGPVLKWVRAADEAEVREALTATLAVRPLNEAARSLADRYFFETVVRVHRAGEGAPYEGLKPSGAVPPIIAAADKALAAGSVDAVSRDLSAALAAALRQRFQDALTLRPRADESPEAGRRYVAAYVEYVHFVERLHDSLQAPAHAPGEGGHEHRH